MTREDLGEIFDDGVIALKAMIIGMLIILIFPIRILNWCFLSVIDLLTDEN